MSSPLNESNRLRLNGTIRDVNALLLTECGIAPVVLYSVSRSTLYVLIQRGEIQSIKIGASRRIPVAALDEFVRRQLQGAAG